MASGNATADCRPSNRPMDPIVVGRRRMIYLRQQKKTNVQPISTAFTVHRQDARFGCIGSLVCVRRYEHHVQHFGHSTRTVCCGTSGLVERVQTATTSWPYYRSGELKTNNSDQNGICQNYNAGEPIEIVHYCADGILDTNGRIVTNTMSEYTFCAKRGDTRADGTAPLVWTGCSDPAVIIHPCLD